MADPLCNSDGCDQPRLARGLCDRHYRHARYHGTLPERVPTTPHAAVTHVARQWGVTVTDILSRPRRPDLVEARRACVHALRDLGLSLPAIGKILGGRNHTTIMHATRTPPGTPPADPDALPDGCQVPGCDRTPKHDGMAFCGGHDRRWRRTGQVDPERPLRPVLVDGPVLDLEVHDRTGYRNGCRCQVCRADAVRSVKRNRHRPQNRPAEAGAAVVRPLLDAGMTVAAVARAAGLSRQTLDRWLAGEGCARQPSIDRVAAVRPPSAPARSAPSAPSCEDCGAEAYGGGRWCLNHYLEHRRAA